MIEKLGTGKPSEVPNSPLERTHAEFMAMPIADVRAALAGPGLIIRKVKPHDLFASQKWTTQEKLMLAEQDYDEFAEDPLTVHAYIYERHITTPEGEKVERRIVLQDQHHRATRRWIPEHARPKNEGLRFNVVVTEVREQREVERIDRPIRFARFRERHRDEFFD